MKKIISIFLIILLVLNILFFALGKISPIMFWIDIVLVMLSSWMLKKFIK